MIPSRVEAGDAEEQQRRIRVVGIRRLDEHLDRRMAVRFTVRQRLLAFCDHLQHLASGRSVTGDRVLIHLVLERLVDRDLARASALDDGERAVDDHIKCRGRFLEPGLWPAFGVAALALGKAVCCRRLPVSGRGQAAAPETRCGSPPVRSEEHTSELQSLMRISYAVFCLKKKKKKRNKMYINRTRHEIGI